MEETAACTHTFNASAEGAVRIVKEHMRCLLRRANLASGRIQCCIFALSMLTGATSKVKVRGRNWMLLGRMHTRTLPR